MGAFVGFGELSGVPELFELPSQLHLLIGSEILNEGRRFWTMAFVVASG